MKNLIKILFSLLMFGTLQMNAQTKPVSLTPPKGKAIAVFAEGCFWCSEHIFEAVVGVDDAVSGYSGGKTNRPTYQEVGSEVTGHAEAVLVYYDPQKVSYEELVKVFFSSHDPTTPNQQGPDRGSSYRSIVFYQNDEEKSIIEKEIAVVSQSKRFKNKVVTEVLPLKVFFKAEDYHQNYIELHPDNPYVRGVSIPRFEMFKKVYKGKLKQEKS
ncbi:peptide-methionine (S)-S-oxide reductase MsrA [Emticicia sp. SJ17W-69]|uniref:peptide-methionine (S)-S-oxide reductase MsrA n=1 Tax=Emticicia sp. SJ17W-69 TaxID=3421657 RepID=UPI003EB8806F